MNETALSLSVHPQLVTDLHKIFPNELPIDIHKLSLVEVAFAMGQQSVLKYLDDVIAMQKQAQADADIKILI